MFGVCWGCSVSKKLLDSSWNDFGAQNGPKIVPKRSQNGPKMVPEQLSQGLVLNDRPPLKKTAHDNFFGTLAQLFKEPEK